MQENIFIDWDSLKELRVIKNLTGALADLGVKNIYLARENLRRVKSEQKYFIIKFLFQSDNQLCERIKQLEGDKNTCFDFCGRCIEGYNEKEMVIIKDCPFGFYEVIVPIKVFGEVVGYLQLIEIVKKGIPFSAIASNFKNINTDLAKLETYYNSLVSFTEEKIHFISSLLELMAKEIEIYYEEKKKELERVNEIQKHSYHGIIYKTKKIDDIIKKIDKIAKSDSPVMIYGESGVGKELFAQAIHKNSLRSSNEFLILNCSALVENLLEAELFGFERGSFTGSIRDKVGLFELAHGGTVFLDEIGDMSSALQVKIMRLIEEGTFLRVGGTKTIKVDVRVIGATNKDLRDLVNRNLFREDLYFRLAVFEILIPSLRDRTDDIPLLVEYFINKYQTKMDKKGIQMSKEALDMLIPHNWPGNVRELENEIERACALVDPYGTILPSSLSEKIVKIKRKIPSDGEYLKDLLNEYEGEVILATLNENKWSKKKVAGRLGITQQWLNKRIHMLALDRRKKR